MISLDVLVMGSLVLDDDKKIVEANSTSVLIKTEDRLIVVDTSSQLMRPGIKQSFKQIGLFPSDVDTVILTHAHHDHVENLDLFENAKVYIRAEEASSIPDSIPVSEDMEIAKGVKLVHTPGHTEGSMSVFVQADRKYAIVGDAIPLRNNFKEMIPPKIAVDSDEALKSIKLITKYADVIIPGHDTLFMTRM